MRRSVVAAVLVGVALASSACSSSGSGSKPAASTAVSASAQASVSAGGSAGSSADAGAEATVKTNWETFFNPKTPEAQRLTLIQGGDQLKPLIDAGLNNPLASSLGVTVSKVVLDSATTATVTFSITLAGKTVLANTTGQAVLTSGTWQVSTASFCTLATLENGGTTPAGCPGGASASASASP